MAEPMRVGIVGCGAISGAYLGMARQLEAIDIVALADLRREAAEQRAAEFGIERVLEPDELLAADDLELVLNLTVPKAHAPVAQAAIAAGKHTYAEKPLGVSRDEGRAVIDAAAAAGLRVGCAPDTFLGAGIQTARQALDEGVIGQPVGFTAFMLCPGHESWHPNPEFYYQVGGGPMFDMGPYYLTALVNLLGPVKRLSAAASIALPERTIGSEAKRGQRIRVETPDHICGTMEFANGCVGTMIQSFATWFGITGGSPITIYGSEGAMRVPDPNGFDGEVWVRRVGDDDWRQLPPAFPTGYGRAIAVADLAHAARTGREHRANGEQAMYVLDLMQGFLDASAAGRDFVPTMPYHRPAPMPVGLPFGVLDD